MTLQIIFTPVASLLMQPSSGLPELQRLLAKGNHMRRAEPASVMLCRLMGVSRQADWPLAALSWLGEGENPGTDYWLCADPAHFVLQRDYFTLSDPVPVPLPQQDAQALLAALNQHFAQDGLQFYAGNSGRWYLRLQMSPEITTTAPEMATGRDISAFLPQGKNAAKWNQLLNEMQMLLHEHVVNQARESAGELPVNSLWFCGGGVLPAPSKSSIKSVFADHALAKGLAMRADVPYFAVPDNMNAVLAQAAQANNSDVLLVLDDAHEAEQKWFTPLLAALKASKINPLSVHFAVRDQVLSVTVTPTDLWKFWRKSKLLETCFMANS